MDLHRLGLMSTRLHYFLAVAELGSIRRAADALHISASSISRIVLLLEQEMEIQLFERTHQRVRLTEAGGALLRHVRASKAELHRACGVIDEIKGLTRGQATLCVVESVARGTLPELLTRFWREHEGIAVDVRVLGSQAAMESVARGEADLAIAFDVAAVGGSRILASTLLSLGALMRPDHPLAGSKAVSLAELRGERLLLSDATLALGTALGEAVDAAHARPSSHTNSIGLMLELAAQGAGVAIQTRLGAEAALGRGELVFLPLRASRLKQRRLVLASRPGAETSRAAMQLAGLAETMLKDLRQREQSQRSC